MVKSTSGTVFPLSALRAVVLHAQRLTAPNGAAPAPTSETIVDLVKALNYVQIDTLNVVNRAHDVALWSRLGSYAIDEFHELIYSPEQRRLYEGWGHAASIISLEHYRFHRWRISKGVEAWLSQADNRQLAKQVLERIRAEGGLRVGHFESDGTPRGAWYDWKPAKMALEVLFACGDLMVADRVNFQRVYDLTERVLPAWVDTTPTSADEGQRFCLEQAALALGVFDLRSLTWYAHMFSNPARYVLKALRESDLLVKIQGESMDGVRTWLIHRDNLPLLQRAADGEIKPQRTTFLAPFDSLFWAGDRDQQMWGFRQVLECYKKPQDRVYGYFCFPILHHDRLVGRFDPKVDRKMGVLKLNALYLEPGIEPGDELVSDIASTMRDFMKWHNANELRIEKSEPSQFGEKLMKMI